MKELINRPNYTNYLIDLDKQNSVKILIGIRRSGKTSLLNLVKEHFIKQGVSKNNILHFNLTSLKYENLTYKELYNQVMESYHGEKLYLFIDEIQIMKDWQKAINSIFEDINCSIYLTGSNSELFLDKYADRLSGRYIVIEVFPLSFKEFLTFKNLSVVKNQDENSRYSYSILDKNNNFKNLNDLFYEYFVYGGMPEIVQSESNQIKEKFLDSIYLSVFVRDVEKYLEQENTTLIQRLIRFLASSIGNRISVNKLKNFLVSNNWIKPNTHSQRIQEILNSLIHSYLFYPVRRFDISGKKELTSLGKFYIADTGIRNNILEYTTEDRGSLFENIVYLELKRRDFTINTGKKDQNEIDFRVRKNGKVSYIQVTETLSDSKLRERELKPLRNLKDAYRRIIITYDSDPFLKHIDGIDIVNIIDFLLDENYLD